MSSLNICNQNCNILLNTISLQVGKISISNSALNISQSILWFLFLTLQKTIVLKCKICIGILTKFPFWCISIFATTLHQIHMMRIQKYLLNIIFIFQIIVSMIQNLCNIVSNFIGNTWGNKDTYFNGIGSRVTNAQANSRATSLGTLCLGIQI